MNTPVYYLLSMSITCITKHTASHHHYYYYHYLHLYYLPSLNTLCITYCIVHSPLCTATLCSHRPHPNTAVILSPLTLTPSPSHTLTPSQSPPH